MKIMTELQESEMIKKLEDHPTQFPAKEGLF